MVILSSFIQSVRFELLLLKSILSIIYNTSALSFKFVRTRSCNFNISKVTGQRVCAVHSLMLFIVYKEINFYEKQKKSICSYQLNI